MLVCVLIIFMRQQKLWRIPQHHRHVTRILEQRPEYSLSLDSVVFYLQTVRILKELKTERSHPRSKLPMLDEPTVGKVKKMRINQ